MAKPKTKKISENYLDSIPVRSQARPWREREDGRIEIDMENTGFYNSIAQKFFKRPRVSHVALDAYGSQLWKLVSGENTVMDIVRGMEKAFPDEQDRMLDRVVTFMATLQNEGFVKMQGGRS